MSLSSIFFLLLAFFLLSRSPQEIILLHILIWYRLLSQLSFLTLSPSISQGLSSAMRSGVTGSFSVLPRDTLTCDGAWVRQPKKTSESQQHEKTSAMQHRANVSADPYSPNCEHCSDKQCKAERSGDASEHSKATFTSTPAQKENQGQ